MKIYKSIYLYITALMLPLLVTLPHLNESFFGGDFEFHLDPHWSVGNALQLWQSGYLGSTSIDSIKLHSGLFEKLCSTIVGIDHGPQLFVYISLALYLVSFIVLMSSIRSYLKKDMNLYGELAIIFLAFISPVTWGYLSNYFTIGITYYTSYAVLAVAALVKYAETRERLWLVLVLIALCLVGHPPTFIFAAISLLLFSLILGVLRFRGCIIFASALILSNLYWLAPLTYSLLDKGSVSLSSDSTTVDHVFDWFNSATNIFQSSLFSIYPNSYLNIVIPIGVYGALFLLIYMIISMSASKLNSWPDLGARQAFLSALGVMASLMVISFGTRYAFGPAFALAWERLPVLHFFKSFSQVLNIAFIYLVLGLYLASLYFTYVIRSRWGRYVIMGLLVFEALILLLVPSLNSFIARGKIPQEYYAAQKIVDSERSPGKVLELPGIAYEFYTWNPNWDNYFASQTLFHNSTVSLNNVTPVISRLMKQNIHDYTSFVQQNNFRYVLVHKDYSTKRFSTQEYGFETALFDKVMDNSYFSLYRLKDEHFVPQVATTESLINVPARVDGEGADIRDFSAELKMLAAATGNRKYAYTNARSADVPKLFSLFADSPSVAPGESILQGAERKQNVMLLQDTMGGNLTYMRESSQIALKVLPPEPIMLNGKPLFDITSEAPSLGTVAIAPNTDYFLEVDKTLLSMDSARGEVGPADRLGGGSIFSVGTNIIPNGSFENGPWNSVAKDCAKADKTGSVSQKIVNDNHGHGSKALQLEATRHIACVDTDILLPSAQNGDYAFSLDYKGVSAEQAGYYLVFDDAGKTVISETLGISRNNIWLNYAKRVTIPKTAHKATVYLYAYDTDGKTPQSVIYDDIKLQQLTMRAQSNTTTLNSKYLEATIPSFATTDILSLADKPGDNIVVNGSFETGPWRKTVDDCGNSETSDKVRMRIVAGSPTTGKNALRLERQDQHIACTWTSISVGRQLDYQLSFDFRGDSGAIAGYHLEFNDPNSTAIEKRLPVKHSAEWSNLSTRFSAPPGATNAKLTIYSYPAEGRTSSNVDYGSVNISNVPHSASYLLYDLDRQLQPPKSSSFTDQSPTVKRLNVSGIKGRFLVSFLQSYHTGWAVYLLPAGQKAFGNEAKKLTSASHMQINGYANGWVIDPNEIKKSFPKKYWQQNGDTINLSLALYFEPQAWFDKILAGTIIVFLLIAAYVAKDWRRRQPKIRATNSIGEEQRKETKNPLRKRKIRLG